jgi:hypothetical protein
MLIPHVWVGIGLPIFIVVNVIGAIHFRMSGQIVTGQVTNLVSHTGKKGRQTFYVNYTYRSSGLGRTAETPIDAAGFGMLNEGDAVEVRVLPGSLRSPQLLAAGTPTEWSKLGGMAFFILGWDGLLLLGFWPTCVRPLIQRGLMQHGIATVGEITGKEMRRAKYTTYTIRYRYRTPPLPVRDAVRPSEEREWQRAMTVVESDYSAISEGTRVTVLYNRRWPRWSLVYRCAPYQALRPPGEQQCPGALSPSENVESRGGAVG